MATKLEIGCYSILSYLWSRKVLVHPRWDMDLPPVMRFQKHPFILSSTCWNKSMVEELVIFQWAMMSLFLKRKNLSAAILQTRVGKMEALTSITIKNYFSSSYICHLVSIFFLWAQWMNKLFLLHLWMGSNCQLRFFLFL